MRKFRRIVFLASVISLMVIFVVTMRKTRTMAQDVTAASDNDLPPTQVMTREDSTLISYKYMVRVRSIENLNSNVMHPVSFLRVDDTYHLAIFSINMDTDQPLNEKLSTDFKDSQRSDDETYCMVDFNGFPRFEWCAWPMKQTRIFICLFTATRCQMEY